MKKSYFTSLFLLIFSACATSHVFEKEDGSFEVFGTAYTQSGAMEEAQNKANETCHSQGKRMLLISQQTDSADHGTRINQTIVIGSKYPAAPTGNSQEYKAVLVFRCK